MSQPPQETPAPTPGPGPEPGPKGRFARPLRVALVLIGLGAGGLLIWNMAGEQLVEQYQEYRTELDAVQDAAPVGYTGLHYRKTYNDRPPKFHFEEGDRTLLWASTGDGETPEFYDVTDARFDPQILQGGFGRDSIPGVDYPILEGPEGEVARNITGRREVAGVELEQGPRAYPIELLQKVEVVNDEDDADPFVILYARGPDTVAAYRRALGDRVLTFGTTGYATDEKVPLLYDRGTEGLWLPSEGGDALVCVSGELVGEELPRYAEPSRMTWRRWRGGHRDTDVLVGNDRSKPIPEQ